VQRREQQRGVSCQKRLLQPNASGQADLSQSDSQRFSKHPGGILASDSFFLIVYQTHRVTRHHFDKRQPSNLSVATTRIGMEHEM
jgi:hypothetical protein